MLDKNLVADVLTCAMSTGGSFAEIFVEETARNRLSLVDNKVDKSRSGIDYGAGIRIFDGTNAVYAYTNDTGRENLLKVAAEAAAAVKTKSNAQIIPLQVLNFATVVPLGTAFDTVAKTVIVDKLKTAGNSAKSYSGLITQVSGVYHDFTSTVLIANTEGVWAEDKREYTSAWFTAIASEGAEKQTARRSRSGRGGFDAFDGLDFAEMGKVAAENAVKMLSAGYAPGGRMPVIISNGWGGVLLHEAIGHSLEAFFVAKKATEFHDKVGTRVAHDMVTVIDDGTIKGGWGSINVDDEGHLPQRNVLVENGILKGFLVDKLSGLKTGLATTGSGRREGYRFAPTSRMTNTFFEAGTSTFDEIIAATEYGLYAKKLGGGSVNPATGDFNFGCDEAYMIRGGKIAEPVRGASLIGKGADVMANVDMLGNDFAIEGGGYCGASSGTVPADNGQPTVRVSEMTVGGRS
ncbi:MAG: TldD/PmbA family protein [Defluviitaleaceae bacterium]|nr:TldD/PmbA family protein [Defluviitaleaceae bacterium]